LRIIPRALPNFPEILRGDGSFHRQEDEGGGVNRHGSIISTSAEKNFRARDPTTPGLGVHRLGKEGVIWEGRTETR
jgi:hypothetical protein